VGGKDTVGKGKKKTGRMTRCRSTWKRETRGKGGTSTPEKQLYKNLGKATLCRIRGVKLSKEKKEYTALLVN